jgi:hypothetical protein
MVAPIDQGMGVGPNIDKPDALEKRWKATADEQVFS